MGIRAGSQVRPDIEGSEVLVCVSLVCFDDTLAGYRETLGTLVTLRSLEVSVQLKFYYTCKLTYQARIFRVHHYFLLHRVDK